MFGGTSAGLPEKARTLIPGLLEEAAWLYSEAMGLAILAFDEGGEFTVVDDENGGSWTVMRTEWVKGRKDLFSNVSTSLAGSITTPLWISPRT